MKKIVINILVLPLLIGLVSCDSYLTHYMGDQMTIEEVFSLRASTQRYLTHIYSYIPQDMNLLDNMTGCNDEASFSWTTAMNYTDHNSGSWNTSTTAFHNWSRMYIGINQATTFINNVDQCLDVTEAERMRMKAEARFLRAYFYFLLVRQYGAVYIWGDNDADMTINSEEVDRHSLDDCINFISDELTKSVENLPETITDVSWYGRATKGCALALKSRLWLYAARPLFNGCYLYRGMTNYWGDYLFPQTEDATKWDKAAEAAKAVIDLNLYELYSTNDGRDDFQKYIHSYMNIFFEKWNSEVIWGRWESSTHHLSVRAQPPLVLKSGYGGYSPSLKLVDTYAMKESGRYPVSGYQSNGTPIIDDKSGYIEEGFTEDFVHPVDYTTIKAHNSCVGREARFYASILWNGMYWINQYDADEPLKLITFYRGGTSSYANTASGDYVKVGYLFRRFNDPKNDTENESWGNYSWPIFRLAEIYLNYAEACNEKSNRNETEALLYVNKIRNRVGLKNLEEAYPEVKGNKELLREYIQKERMLELAFENHRYWDIRQWMIAETESNGARWARNLAAENFEDSWERTNEMFSPLVFERKHYLFPIHQTQLEEMRNITQNWGW